MEISVRGVLWGSPGPDFGVLAEHSMVRVIGVWRRLPQKASRSLWEPSHATLGAKALLSRRRA